MKRAALARRPQVVEGFPRRTRRGLIEAARVNIPSGLTLDHFPGGHAGASLKQRHPRRVDVEPADFPGGHAGASLKLPVEPPVDPVDVGFPRRTRRGLIEAGYASRQSTAISASISPADTPGPH